MTEALVSTVPARYGSNGWLEILPPLAPPNVLSGEQAFDFAVVGGGFAGLAAARRLGELNPDARIALIEAGRIGDNAAGRCSGFAIDQAHNIRASDFAGQLQAERDQLRLNRAGQAYLREVVAAHRIDCDWREEGKIHGAATPRGEGLLGAYRGNLELLGLDYSERSADEMRAITGTSFYRAGLETPGTILVQPAALVIGLALSLPANVTVFEASAVTHVAYGPPHRLTSHDGVLTAPQMVLATNGFIRFFGFYEREIIPIATYGSLTRPMTDKEAARLGGRESWGIIPADPFGTSVRRVADGRILIRNIYAYSPKGEDARTDHEATWVVRRHRRSLARRFPMLKLDAFEHSWGGPLALSKNGQPIFGRLGEGVFAAACQNGVGIARGTIHGKLIAEEMSGVESAELDILRAAGRPDKLPPWPFLGLGVEANFAYRRFRAGREL